MKYNIIEAANLAFEDKGIVYTIEEMQLTFDIPSFFENYEVINLKALSKRIGMNQSLLSQYVHRIKKPSQKQADRILKGIHDIGKELSDMTLLVK